MGGAAGTMFLQKQPSWYPGPSDTWLSASGSKMQEGRASAPSTAARDEVSSARAVSTDAPTQEGWAASMGTLQPVLRLCPGLAGLGGLGLCRLSGSAMMAGPVKPEARPGHPAAPRHTRMPWKVIRGWFQGGQAGGQGEQTAFASWPDPIPRPAPEQPGRGPGRCWLCPERGGLSTTGLLLPRWPSAWGRGYILPGLPQLTPPGQLTVSPLRPQGWAVPPPSGPKGCACPLRPQGRAVRHKCLGGWYVPSGLWDLLQPMSCEQNFHGASRPEHLSDSRDFSESVPTVW